MKLLMKDSKTYDFTIEVEGQQIGCHKVILATKCEFFAGMLSSNMLENSSGEPFIHKQSLLTLSFRLNEDLFRTDILFCNEITSGIFLHWRSHSHQRSNHLF